MKSIYKILLFLIGFATSGHAQDSLLTKTEAVQLALENNYGIRIADNNLQIAGNNKSIYNSGYLPTLSGSAGANYRKASSNSEFESRDPVDVTGAVSKTYNASLGAGYLLFNGFGRKNTLKSLQES